MRLPRFTRVSDGNERRRLLEISKAGEVFERAELVICGHGNLLLALEFPGPLGRGSDRVAGGPDGISTVASDRKSASAKLGNGERSSAARVYPLLTLAHDRREDLCKLFLNIVQNWI